MKAKAVSKLNRFLELRVLSFQETTFTGKYLADAKNWRKGQVSRSFAIKDYDIVIDMSSYKNTHDNFNNLVKLLIKFDR